MHRKVLIAFDGSIFSSNSLHYLGHLFSGERNIHFHLLSLVRPELELVNRDWIEKNEMMEMVSPATRKVYQLFEEKLKNASRQLCTYNINPEQITTKVQFLRANRADDIIHEARRGLFDALIIGRRGLTPLEELVIGSVSSTVLEKCHNVPIWLIDGRINSRKFLVPVDGSPACLRAVDHLAFILKGNSFAEITLFHSTAMFSSSHQLDKCIEEEPVLNKKPASGYDYFQRPEQILLDSGFPAQRIHRLETSKGMYASRQIVRQALIDEHGTIVMGRRHGEIIKGFGHITGMFKSTSEKVIAMAENTAIWLVG